VTGSTCSVLDSGARAKAEVKDVAVTGAIGALGALGPIGAIGAIGAPGPTDRAVARSPTPQAVTKMGNVFDLGARSLSSSM
jgi:hypothetical protein